MMNDINDASTVTVCGEMSKGACSGIDIECYHIDWLNDEGEVVTYWDESIAFEDLPY